ncbi:hypothetical protein [Natrarchaeobaculum sulfurireducens]|uniref:Uncharacterized protein n=1 Tax=Natrarchaeobaculum sulfurireducens TaxID=2044521 RepID=A0A346PLD6_9EURY|nr:hypothetical protein AArc1_0317 [Natrarchaeobaculum sulfurireducens]AXR80331.1 hypothetical protein AArcMg_0308 [Natrarchaeobaculum sulfurireducens]
MIAFFLPLNKVLVPFAFVFSQGILLHRDGAVVSVFLMVPEIPLLIAEGLLAMAGVPSALTIFAVTFPLRLVGLAILVGLTYQNRSRTPEPTGEPAAPAASDA